MARIEILKEVLRLAELLHTMTIRFYCAFEIRKESVSAIVRHPEQLFGAEKPPSGPGSRTETRRLGATKTNGFDAPISRKM
jgi:hypothetical protein